MLFQNEKLNEVNAEYLITTVLENCNIARTTLETLDDTFNTDNIEETIEENDSVIKYLMSITDRTFFQALPEELQDMLSGIIAFLNESVNENKYISSNRLIVPKGMVAKQNLITTDRVKKIFEIALGKYLIFIKIIFTEVLTKYKDQLIEMVGQDKTDELVELMEEIDSFDALKEKEEEFFDYQFDTYMKIKYTTFEDEMSGEDEDILEDVEIKGFTADMSDFDVKGF